MIAPPRARSSSGLWNHPKAGRSSSPNQTGRALVTLSSWRGCCAFGACRAGSPVPPFASGVEAVAKPDMTSSEPSNVLGPPDLSAQLSRALRPSVSSPRRERLPYSPKKPYLWLRPAPSCAHADKVRGLNEEILEDLEATDQLHGSSDVMACLRTSPVSTASRGRGERAVCRLPAQAPEHVGTRLSPWSAVAGRGRTRRAPCILVALRVARPPACWPASPEGRA